MPPADLRAAHSEFACPRCADGALLREQARKITNALKASERAAAAQDMQDELRAAKAEIHALKARLEAAQRPRGVTTLTVYYDDSGAGFSEGTATMVPIGGGDQTYSLRIPGAALQNMLRLDLGDTPGIYELHELAIFDASGRALCRLRGAHLILRCSVRGTALAIADGASVRLWATDIDPQVWLRFPKVDTTETVLLRVRMTFYPNGGLPDELLGYRLIRSGLHRAQGLLERGAVLRQQLLENRAVRQ